MYVYIFCFVLVVLKYKTGFLRSNHWRSNKCFQKMTGKTWPALDGQWLILSTFYQLVDEYFICTFTGEKSAILIPLRLRDKKQFDKFTTYSITSLQLWYYLICLLAKHNTDSTMPQTVLMIFCSLFIYLMDFYNCALSWSFEATQTCTHTQQISSK